jgi:hypothetical protein
MKKFSLATVVAVSLFGNAFNAVAALTPGTKLVFDPGVWVCVIGGTWPNCQLNDATLEGSYFGMAQSPSNILKTALKPGPDGGIIMGEAQPASGTHGGCPNGSESPGIDKPWCFFGQTGLDLTTAGPTVNDPDVNSDGGFTQTLNLPWGLSWNGIPVIPIPGIATVVCDQADCAAGGGFVLDMALPIPPNPAHGFGGVPYSLHMEGTIVAPPLTANVYAEPRTLNVKSKGNGFKVSIELEDTDGSTVDAAGVDLGVNIVSIDGMTIPAGAITENTGARVVIDNVDPVNQVSVPNGITEAAASFDDAATGDRQDIIAVVSDLPDGSDVEICVAGTAEDASGTTRDFEGCSTITIKNKGNR